MKKPIALVLAFFVLTFTTKAQEVKEADVPAIVKEAFAKKYPGANAKWEKEESDFEAEFKLDKIESSAVFALDGTFKELEQEMQVADLSKIIRDYCDKNYTGYKLSEAAKITKANGKILYEAEMSKGKEEFDVLFDDKGNFISKGKVENEEGDAD